MREQRSADTGNLVLTRRVGESFLIGDDVTVTVVGLLGESKVRIAVTAPRSIRVDRHEVRRAREKAEGGAA